MNGWHESPSFAIFSESSPARLPCSMKALSVGCYRKSLYLKTTLRWNSNLA